MTTRLFHVSDVHFGAENRAALDEVARAVADEKPDALICTGDITQRARHREYAAAQEWFSSLGVPVLLDPGNHDMPYYNLWERFTAPYARFYRLRDRLGGEFSSRDVVLVPLKTTVRAQTRFPWSDGVVTRSALRKTMEALHGFAEDARTLIVTAHHPLLGPAHTGRNPTIGGDKAFAALAGAGVDAVLSGHVHNPFDEKRTAHGATMRMIGAGTLSTRLRHGAPPSWRVLECGRGGQVEVELRIACEGESAP